MSEEILSDAEIDFISLPDEIIVILDTESENGKFTLSFSLMLWNLQRILDVFAMMLTWLAFHPF